MIREDIKKTLINIANSSKHITVLTGAGISAESHIPTFRGPEGYWAIGSQEYHPQEMATYRMFTDKPYEVWKWYLYRMGVCAKAEPNPGHLALVEMEKIFPDRFTLITQNVDNMHIRAGNSLTRTFQIHGNIFFVRCAGECSEDVYIIPDGLKGKEKGEDLSKEEKELLVCEDCGGMIRPHVLWFDETYNEVYYRFQSSLAAASQTDLLIIVGTSGATNLPNQVAWQVYHNSGTILDINIEENPFSKLAIKSGNGAFIKGPSAEILPEIVDALKNS